MFFFLGGLVFSWLFDELVFGVVGFVGGWQRVPGKAIVFVQTRFVFPSFFKVTFLKALSLDFVIPAMPAQALFSSFFHL